MGDAETTVTGNRGKQVNISRRCRGRTMLDVLAVDCIVDHPILVEPASGGMGEKSNCARVAAALAVAAAEA